ncbi:hypothetical protein O0V02_19575, partial [Gordonia amicalis]|uniref:hypothetical protein n=1 Tax=Gordonia amicalis TaxID=89053 RepID=UPI0022A7901D
DFLMAMDIGCLWLFHGGVAIAESRWLYVAFYVPGASGALLLAGWAGVLIARRRGGLPLRIDSVGRGGVTIAMPVAQRVGYVVMLASTVVACAVFAYGLWTGHLNFPMTARQQGGFPYTACAIGAYAAGLLVFSAIGWLRFPKIICTPTTLIVQSSKVRDEIAWTDVEAIRPSASGNSMAILVEPRDGAKVEVEVFYRGPFSPSPEDPIVCNVDLFPTGPEAMLDFLRYYLDHPEAREELGDGRAVERLQ